MLPSLIEVLLRYLMSDDDVMNARTFRTHLRGDDPLRSLSRFLSFMLQRLSLFSSQSYIVMREVNSK